MVSNPRQQTCFSFLMPQKPFKFLLYKTNRLHFSVCVYCNRSLFCSLHAVTSSVTHTRGNVIYLLAFSGNDKAILHHGAVSGDVN